MNDRYDHKGFVGVFDKPLVRAHINDIVAIWLERFDRVEQVIPEIAEGATRVLQTTEDIMEDRNMSFRVSFADDFAWTYVTPGTRAIETTGFPGMNDQPALCFVVLLELPGLAEVVDERNNARLDQLEHEGVFEVAS